jgi:hypothetical protein
MVTVIGDGGVRNGFVFVPPTPFTVTSTPPYNIVNFLPGSLVVRTGEGVFLTTFSAVLPKRIKEISGLFQKSLLLFLTAF